MLIPVNFRISHLKASIWRQINNIPRLFSQNSGTSLLKTSIRKSLFLRLLFACILISVALAGIVLFIELHRVGGIVNDRGSEIAARFNDEVRQFLDMPISAAKPALQHKLKVLAIAGKMNLGMGRIIYAGIFDLTGKAIVVEKDSKCSYLNEVDAVMITFGHQIPNNAKGLYEYQTINGTPHIQLIYPLTNSKNEQVAVIEGLFAVSAKARDDVVARITRTAFEAIGIVLLTTVTLYPIIWALFGRLSGLAGNLLTGNIETLQVLGSAIAKRDSDTHIHNFRVTIYSVTLAEAFGLSHSQIRTLIKGAFLHDVGKIGISDQILLKPGKLTYHECEIMKGHVNHGIDIVKRSDWLKDTIDVVGYHHEKYKGGGYPYGLKGEAIPVTARIFAIADVFDALTSTRPYKAPMPFSDAMAIIEEGRGNHFDPTLVDAFNGIAKSLYENIATCSDQALRDKLESITQQYFSKDMYMS